MKKVSKIGTLQRKCDRLMQEAGKKLFPKSIISGRPTEVMHHYIPKSVCSALRYDFENLIPLTNAEHCRLHQSPDPSYEVVIYAKMGGETWWQRLQQKRWQTMKVNREYYQKVYEKLSNLLSRELQ
jgi:hypothetical protein